VVRQRAGRFRLVLRSRFATVPDTGVHLFPTSLAVRAGDLVGLEVAPGAAIGVRPAATAGTERWIGPLGLRARPAEFGSGSGLDDEVLLRVEYRAGARATTPGLLTGPAARRVPAGRELVARDVELAGGVVRTVSLRRLEGEIALDLIAAGDRLARLALPDLDPGGRLVELSVPYGRTPRLVWRNPEGEVRHDFDVRRSALTPRG
jgi:hypothetical protein